MSDANVLYHFGPQNSVDVEVLVSKSNGELHITAALPVLGSGQWEVIWKLKAGDNVTTLTFDPTDGIKPKDGDWPPELHIQSTGRVDNAGTGSSWRTVFQNCCQSANRGKYFVTGTADGQSFHLEDPNTSFHHDPTIAVVSDPITG